MIAEAGWDTRHFYQNEGTAVVFQPDQWYCIEVLVQLDERTGGPQRADLAIQDDQRLLRRVGLVQGEGGRTGAVADEATGAAVLAASGPYEPAFRAYRSWVASGAVEGAASGASKWDC